MGARLLASLLALAALLLQGCQCRWGEEGQCLADGQADAEEACRRLDASDQRTPYEKGHQDGYDLAVSKKGHRYTWLEYLRDVIVELIMIIAGLLLLGAVIGHSRADDTETFAETKKPAQLLRRRTMVGLEHLGVLKGEGFHKRQTQQPLLE
ncbi:unnamed protein product [Effrenium voratum]|nr:unnamed protein product [Effrenium voratum]